MSYDLAPNAGYLVGLLAKASLNNNPEKLRKAAAALNFLSDPNTSVGSRTPAGAPEWVTLEVATGGFATGNFLAGGALQKHEVELYQLLINKHATAESLNTETVRGELNRYFLSPAGLPTLSTFLESTQYRVRVPEEGALLAILWLNQNGYSNKAKNAVDAILPYFNSMRFYPIPDPAPLSLGAKVSVETTGTVLNKLYSVSTPELLLRQKDVVNGLCPFIDELVEAVLATSDGGELPELVKAADGKVTVTGSLPFKKTDAELNKRLKDLLDEFEKLPHNVKNVQRIRKGHTGILLKIVQWYIDKRPLTEKNIFFARKYIAEIGANRGLPGAPRLRDLREKQLKDIRFIGIKDLMRDVLVDRLNSKSIDKNSGLEPEALQKALAPVSEQEANRGEKGRIAPLTPIFAPLAEKVRSAKMASIEELCDEGIVPSEEVLAKLTPALVSAAKVTGESDRTFAALYSAIYSAFKNRRSLLLLNYATQVKISELPWFQPLEEHRTRPGKKINEVPIIRGVLEDIVAQAIRKWPGTMFPNKYVGVLEDLGKTISSAEFPFVKELASDIFMGGFAPSWVSSSKIAASLLKGTLYERYYDIQYDLVGRFKGGGPGVEEFNDMCRTRAGEDKKWDIVGNGKQIEQSMILTTHNLAISWVSLAMGDKLGSLLPSLARNTFDFIISETKNLTSMPWKTRLQRVKNSAYAWRQMVFYLSFLSEGDVDEFFMWVWEKTSSLEEKYKARIIKPVIYLEYVWKEFKANKGDNNTTQKEKKSAPEECVFLGWTKGNHFMLKKE